MDIRKKHLAILFLILFAITTVAVMQWNTEDIRKNFDWAYKMAPLMKHYKTSEDTLFVLVEDNWIKIIREDGRWELPKIFDDDYYRALRKIKSDRKFNLKPEEN